MKATYRNSKSETFAKAVGVALRRAAKSARKTAKMYGTPLYYFQDGKIVSEKP